MPVFEYEKNCTNKPNEVIRKGLDSVINQVPYKILGSNCQNLTSSACQNKSTSPDADKWIGRALLGGIAALLIGGVVAASQEIEEKGRKTR